ncbi:MAG: single-stranded DNA-binding protein [Bacteroidales bacterium]|jgi:single-strand DNA-binding protein|nr:single-stranded DNA-binding protein [Bacteroidales bacterium]MCI2122439.1 single-stranded DNA-binding protein [Bacteroidales bacterium]MCI2145945.1 single-stranded DNA-binding protein [Bacteroidales bacterium]
MMEKKSFNRVELLGHVGMDPKIIEKDGKKMARFTLATNERFHDRKGQIQEETTWHNISAWEGEKIMNLEEIRKGLYLLIRGSIRNSKYLTTDGEARYFSEIRANAIRPAGEEEKED